MTRIVRSQSQHKGQDYEDTKLWYLVKFIDENYYGIIKERDLRFLDQEKC